MTNTGTGEATNVNVTDVLPANWSYVDLSATVTPPTGPAAQVDPTVSGQTLLWSNVIATLQPGETVTIDFTTTPDTAVTTPPPGVGSAVPQTNTVNVAARDGGTYLGNANGLYTANDDATARIHSADLRVVKTASTATPVAGTTFNWLVNVANLGPDPAVGPIVVTDTLPSGVTAAGSATGTGWSCTLPDADAGNTFTCMHSGPVAFPGTLPQITVPVTVPADTPDGTALTNTATVEARTFDPVPGNNTSTSPVTVDTEADIEVVKTLTGGALTAGSPAQYTLDVSNNGPSVAWKSPTPIVVTDVLPAGLTSHGVTAATGTAPTRTAPAPSNAHTV